jgi:hypothetical protein
VAISERREIGADIGKIAGKSYGMVSSSLGSFWIDPALHRRIRVLQTAKNGAPETIRTSDLCLRRPNYYPLADMPDETISNDWGVCTNPRSHRCSLLTFEHQGCKNFQGQK